MDRDALIKAMAVAFIAKRHGADFQKAQKHDPQYAAYVIDDARRTMSDVLDALEPIAIVTPRTAKPLLSDIAGDVARSEQDMARDYAGIAVRSDNPA
jgi:hypothetical protein